MYLCLYQMNKGQGGINTPAGNWFSSVASTRRMSLLGCFLSSTLHFTYFSPFWAMVKDPGSIHLTLPSTESVTSSFLCICWTQGVEIVDWILRECAASETPGQVKSVAEKKTWIGSNNYRNVLRTLWLWTHQCKDRHCFFHSVGWHRKWHIHYNVSLIRIVTRT